MLAVLLAALAIQPETSHAQTRIINSNGGQCSFDGPNGGLRILVASNAQLQVERCSANGSAPRSRQYYLSSRLPPDNLLFNALYLRVGDQLVGTESGAG